MIIPSSSFSYYYFTSYTRTDSRGQTAPLIGAVSVGGESGPDARVCDYAWVLNVHMQCVEYSVPFSFHQTGARLKKGDKIYEIPREHQHEQARKAHLDFNGTRLPAWDVVFETDTMV